MAKSPDAFRTISEVADWLGVQAHVLRFWESKFSQVKPVKRAGGRRYYRPSDMLLLGGIRRLLHEDGLTIKGVQKILREHGMSHVADLSQPLDDLTLAVLDGSLSADPEGIAAEASEPAQGVVLSFDDLASARAEAADKSAPADDDDGASLADPAPESDQAQPADAPSETATEPEVEPEAEPEGADALPELGDLPEPPALELDLPTPPEDADTEPEFPELSIPAEDAPDLPDPVRAQEPEQPDPAPQSDGENIFADDPDSDPAAEPVVLPSFRRHRPSVEPSAAEPVPADTEPEAATPDAPQAPREPVPDEPHPVTVPQPDAESPSEAEAISGHTELVPEPEIEPEPAIAAPRPRVVDIGELPVEADIVANASALSALQGARRLTRSQSQALRPLLARLSELNDRIRSGADHGAGDHGA
ncbi:MerR family transcriptional regulator [Sulfitobacter sp. LCG007]